MFDITEEIRKLREIKDIQDELQMIDDVFLKQTTAIHALDIALGYNDVPVAKALRSLKKDRDIIRQYQSDAKQAYAEVNFSSVARLKASLMSENSLQFC